MVLNLFRLSKYLRSNWPVVTCDCFCAQNPIGRLVELASEHSRLSRSMETALKLWNSDAVTCQHDSGTNRVTLAFLVPEWFKSIAGSFYKSGLFFSKMIFFPINHHAPCKSCIKFPEFWGVCRVHSLTSSLALKIPTTLSLIREESPWSCLSNGAKLV